MINKIKESELVLNPDGSVYHLKLQPEDIADTIIAVGDMQRVSMISEYFDKIEIEKQNREFLTHTGTIGKKRITVLSTGIGTDNIDIVMNELDALVNINLKTREILPELKKLKIIRLGTSGAVQKDIAVDSIVMSAYGLGFDGLLNYYDTSVLKKPRMLLSEFKKHTQWGRNLPEPYMNACSSSLARKLGKGLVSGITATASGFYAPQGRELRLKVAYPNFNECMESFKYKDLRVVNYEMETSALYGLGKLLGHDTLTLCAIIANRVAKEFSKDYKKTVKGMVEMVLERLTA